VNETISKLDEFDYNTKFIDEVIDLIGQK